jgi:hypothetical protein
LTFPWVKSVTPWPEPPPLYTTLAPEHFFVYAAIQALMAFCCAVDPSDVSEPVAQSAEVLPDDEPPPAALVFVDEPPLLPHAASAATATSTPASTPARLSFTIGSPLSV